MRRDRVIRSLAAAMDLGTVPAWAKTVELQLLDSDVVDVQILIRRDENVVAAPVITGYRVRGNGPSAPFTMDTPGANVALFGFLLGSVDWSMRVTYFGDG